MRQVTCPTCGWEWRSPFGLNIYTTPWVDTCACRDAGPCVYHQGLGAEPPPVRPPEAVLRERAQRDFERRVSLWEKKAIELNRAEEKEGWSHE